MSPRSMKRITAAAPVVRRWAAAGAFSGSSRQRAGAVGHRPQRPSMPKGLLAMRAPRPVCIISEVSGPRQEQRNREAYERVRRFYDLRACRRAAGIRSHDGPHGFCSSHHWPHFRRWLAKVCPADQPPGTGKPFVPVDSLRVTKTGHAFFSRELPGCETIVSVNQQRIRRACDCKCGRGRREAARAVEPAECGGAPIGVATRGRGLRPWQLRHRETPHHAGARHPSAGHLAEAHRRQPMPGRRLGSAVQGQAPNLLRERWPEVEALHILRHRRPPPSIVRGTG